MIEEGQPAPEFRAPSSKGHTLELGSFADRVAVALFFLDSLDQPDDEITLAVFDDLLVEFGQRRVQALGVAPAAPRALHDATNSLAVPVLADEDGSIREAFGGYDLVPFTTIIDRHGMVAAVIERRTAEHPHDVLRAVDALQAERPEPMHAQVSQHHIDHIPAEPAQHGVGRTGGS